MLRSYFRVSFFLTLFLPISLSCQQTVPESISAYELENLRDNWKTQFNWCTRWHKVPTTISFCYENEDSGFAITVLGIPIFSHRYRLLPTWQELTAYFSFSSYLFAQPLIIKGEVPAEIDCNNLCEIIQKNNVLFYTGAGISAASGIPTMNELESSLKITHNIGHFYDQATKNREEIADAFTQFCHAAIHSIPTPAHYALTEIAKKKSANIATENVDLMHQSTGIKVISPLSQETYSLICSDNLKKVDVIICIGLSHDDRGILGLYKASNPNGIIVAIDLKQPNYLSTNDYFLQGNIQEIIPKMAQDITL